MQEVSLPLDITLSPVTRLKAGELHCMYEQGKLRYIRWGKTELLRMIYMAVRAEHWATLPYTIEDENIHADSNGFFIQYTAVYRQPCPVYKAYFTIEGRPDSSISFSVKGEVLAPFKRNRIGICLHHPIKECGGQAVVITRPDGSDYQSVFPEMVSPHQPLLDIQTMKWVTVDNTNVAIFFEGDVFETEDQRNWSDSSYKTYSTPLHIPYPVSLMTGDTMQQKITITASRKTGNAEPRKENIREEKIAFPKIGYSRSAGQSPLTTAEIRMLQKITFHHYRVMFAMDEKGWEQEWKDAVKEAWQLNALIELVVFFSDDYTNELDALLAALNETQAQLYSVLVLQINKSSTPPDLFADMYPLIKEKLPAVQMGYGTDSNFVNINRNRPVDTMFDFVAFSLHPQAHMDDNRSIVENLDNQPDMIATAKHFAGGKPVFVSPVTIKDRYDLPPIPDDRQYTAFAAWWMLMSLQQLAAADSITFCELLGHAGLLRIHKNERGETVSIQPSFFYEMLAIMHSFQPGHIIKRYLGNELLMDGLLLENAAGERLMFKGPEWIF